MAADIADAVRGADLILLAVPVLAMEPVLRQLAALDLGSAVITDTGSTKTAVVEAVRQAYGRVPPRFVPGHPIAGSERSGVEAADAGLFRRHKVILDGKSTRLNSSHVRISYAVFCLKKKNEKRIGF